MSNEKRELTKEEIEILMQIPSEKHPETAEEKIQFETERTEKKFALFFDLLEFVEQNPESYLAQKFSKVVNLSVKGK